MTEPLAIEYYSLQHQIREMLINIYLIHVYACIYMGGPLKIGIEELHVARTVSYTIAIVISF